MTINPVATSLKNCVQRILVPIDFTDSSITAIEYAVKLARALGAALTLLDILEPTVETERDSADAQLQNLARLFVPRDVPVELIGGGGKSHAQILGAIPEVKPDLIVVLNRQCTAPRHWFRRSRSTIAELLKQTNCPVVVLRRDPLELGDYVFL